MNELVATVGIALGTLAASDCVNADRNGDGVVTVAEIVNAVGALLYGCYPS